jgi:acyl-CoA thioester hydrolase
VAEDRFTMEYRLVSRKLGEMAADGGGVLVSYDYGAGRKAPLPHAVRAAIERLEASVR